MVGINRQNLQWGKVCQEMNYLKIQLGGRRKIVPSQIQDSKIIYVTKQRREVMDLYLRNIGW